MIVGVISKCAEVKIQGLGMPCENIPSPQGIFHREYKLSNTYCVQFFNAHTSEVRIFTGATPDWGQPPLLWRR